MWLLQRIRGNGGKVVGKEKRKGRKKDKEGESEDEIHQPDYLHLNVTKTAWDFVPSLRTATNMVKLEI